MKKLLYLAIAFLAAVCCTEVEETVSSPLEVCFSVSEQGFMQTKSGNGDAEGCDSLFAVTCEALGRGADTLYARTKGIAVVTGENLDGFYLGVTSGGNSSPVAGNIYFEAKGNSLFAGGLYWPSTDRSYRFYASNVQMETGSGSVKIVCSGTDDIVWARNDSPEYGQTNNLAFSHVYARIGRLSLSAPEGMTATLKSAVITASTGGVFDLRSSAWLEVSSVQDISLSSSNDAWIVPGTYEISVSYGITDGAMLQQELVRSGSAEFKANAVNNITAFVTYDDYIVSYGNPYGLTISCDDIPSSGGTVATASVTGICRQKAYYASGKEEEIVIENYSRSWSPAVVASSLGTMEKTRSKVGTLTLTYSANGCSSEAAADVHQAGNRIESTSYGEWTLGQKQYGSVTYGPKEYGAVSYGEKIYGEWTFGEKRYGPEYAGTTSFGEEYRGSTSTGSEYMEDKSYGSEYPGETTYGTVQYGDWIYGAKSYGASSTQTRNYAVSISADKSSVPVSGGNVLLSWAASHESRTATPYTVGRSRTVSRPWTRPLYKDWTRSLFRDDVIHYVHDGTTPYYKDYTRSMTRSWTRSTTTAWSRSKSTGWTRQKSRIRTDIYTSGASRESEDISSDSGTDTGTDSGSDSGTDSGSESQTDSGTDFSRNVKSTVGTRDVTQKVFVRKESGRDNVSTQSGTDVSSEEGTPESGTDYSGWTTVSDTPSISGSAAGFSRNGSSVTASPNHSETVRSVTYTATNNDVSDSVTISQSADRVIYTEYSITPITLSKTLFTPAGGTAVISGGEGKIVYEWESGRFTYGSFTPEGHTNNTMSSVSGNVLTVYPVDGDVALDLYVYYRHPDGCSEDVEAHYTQLGFESLTATVSRQTVYYGQSTSVKLIATYTDGSSEDITKDASFRVTEYGYVISAGETFTHNRLNQTSDVMVHGTASYMSRSVPFTFTIGMRHYDSIEITKPSNGISTLKPGFRARWNDTGEWVSCTNGDCNEWYVGSTRLNGGDEAEAKNFAGFAGQIVIHKENQTGRTLEAGISARVENNKWYFDN